MRLLFFTFYDNTFGLLILNPLFYHPNGGMCQNYPFPRIYANPVKAKRKSRMQQNIFRFLGEGP